jgi:chaperonin GroEL (HSP60 family)
MYSKEYNDFKEDIRIGTNVIDGNEYKDTLQAVSDITCDIVTKTLGPYASTTVIDDGTSTYPTKDGWSLINRLRFSDAIENVLFGFIKQISFSLNSKVGDGTTSAIVAANKFINKFREWIDTNRADKNGQYHNIRQADLLDAITKTSESIIAELKTDARVMKIESADDIYKIAYISTNGNEEISSMIRDIYEQTNNPNIHVTLNTGGQTRYEIENGYKLDASLLNPSCHFNTGEETCVINEDSKIVIFDHAVTYVKHHKLINSLIQSICNNPDKPQNLIILAPFYDEVFSSIMAATIRKITNSGQISPIVLVQVPASTLVQKCYLNDFAILCETQIFDGTKLEMYSKLNKILSGEVEEDTTAQEAFAALLEASNFKTPEDIIACSIGKCRKLTIGKNFILLEQFRKDLPMYVNTLEHIKEEYEAAKKSADAKQNRINMAYADAHMRYIKFTGQTGTIFVGGDSELSCKCLKDAVDDAVLACRSAFEYGYVRGLNIETLSAIKYLRDNCDDDLTSACLTMFYDVFSEMSIDVMYNKYINDGISRADFPILGLWKLQGLNPSNDEVTTIHLNAVDIINYCVEHNTEYNIITEEANAPGYSVVNSVATDVEVIRAVTSILALLLSSNQLISISRQFDRKKSIEDAERREQHRYANIAEGIVDVINNKFKGFTINPKQE